jgi:hypothetical protein
VSASGPDPDRSPGQAQTRQLGVQSVDVGPRTPTQPHIRAGQREEIRTDNGKVFKNRHTPFRRLETMFNRMCRENGVVHRLTAVRSPTTTGKIERFHRALKDGLLCGRPLHESR